MLFECVWLLFGCHLYVFAFVVECVGFGFAVLRMLFGLCLDAAYMLFSGC